MKRDDITADFLRQVASHELQVLRDDGVYRHLRFKRPGSWCMHFDIVTWPGYLAYTGDMGCYVFTRLQDMLEFFRRDPDRLFRIDFRYWAEKAQGADRDGIREFCPEKFTQQIKRRTLDWIRDHRDDTTREQRRELWNAVIDEVVDCEGDNGGHRQQIAAYEFSHELEDGWRFHFDDLYELSFEVYTHRFLWCCHALAWGINRYDAHRDALKAQAQPA